MSRGWGDPGQVAAAEGNFAQLLWRTAARNADRTAVIQREQVTTYAELTARAAAIAAALVCLGIRPGDRVGIFLERGADAAAAFFGVLAAGAVAININERLRPRQVEYVLEHAGTRALLTDPELLTQQPRALATGAAILMVGDLPQADDTQPVARAPGDIAQIIYTSGSTGLPKGVTLTQANLWAGMRAVTQYLQIRPDDRLASFLPFSFDYGLNQVFCAAAAGAALVIDTSPLPSALAAALREQQVTVLAAVPPLWLQLLGVKEFEQSPLPSLRVMTNTGGRLPSEAVRRLRRAQPQADLFLMYGLTEAFRATYLPPAQADRRPDSIGKAIPGAEILVVDDNGRLCRPGEIGELVQAGPTVAAGYWNDPEATARVFRRDPRARTDAADGERVVYSGDLVRSDEEGFLYYVGRRDRMIKTLGFRVSPDEIVDVLYASGQIVEGVVATESSPLRGESIVAYVVLRADGSLETLRAFCRNELPQYMQPARIEPKASLPRTSSGKHDVKLLSELVGRISEA
jgi:acyl-CoA ligase (AMP-forming) (exosortase A-associated)